MTVAFVQQVSNSSATAVASLSVSITTTAGNLLVIYVSGPHVDNGSNTSFTGISPTIGIGYGGTSSVTLTAAPSAGATSATLTAGWGGPTQPYVITFSTGEQRVATVTNGGTSLNWANGGGGLASSATTALNIQGDQGLTGYYVANVSGGAKTITVTDANSALKGIYAAEYSGCATSSPLLAVTGGLANGPGVGTDTITTVAVPSSSTPGLVAAMTIPGNWDAGLVAGDVTAGTGYTGHTTVWAGAGAGYPEDKFPSSGVSFGPTWSSSSNAQYDPFFSVAMIFKAASSGTNYNLTAAQGSYSLTGEVATLSESGTGVNYNLAAATGTFSLSGESALRDLALGASKGSFSFTGYSVKAGYGLGASKGSFGFTGFAATLFHGTSVPNAISGPSRRFIGRWRGRR